MELRISARLAQSVEHGTLNPGVVGSSPTLGGKFFFASAEACQVCLRPEAVSPEKVLAEIAQLGER